ncbi:type II toxin-antitoxin system RelE/ParE family toxin [Pseudomonas sp. NPDC090202]|uniref:type II toxin-antitoxin system RelE/ParE family toxin n=1 Tax=unclassified Pseudomonas TaxID=196821 RepID=UPI00382FF3F1
MVVLKRRDFARWQVSEDLSDGALCNAVREMESGLIDADLGGCLYKKRIARTGSGKSAGYRTLLSARSGDRYVFLFGFAKSARANVSTEEKKAMRYAGKLFLSLSGDALALALQAGTLEEVHCDQQNH